MLLHLADQNLKSFGSGPSSWNFAYESRNKSMKAIHTNGKSNLERTLLERHLVDAHLEDYVSTLPPSVVKNLKLKKESPLTADDFRLLLEYYTQEYKNAQYTLHTGSNSEDQEYTRHARAMSNTIVDVEYIHYNLHSDSSSSYLI